MTGLRIDDGRICGVDIEPGGAIETEHVFLGLGHSARDTIRTLHDLGVAMEQKPFQLGARIEHPQDVINRMQYGPEFCTHPLLPAADYRLVAKIPGGDVFSFCMCPGGEILPATERPGVICVNGASPLGRRGRFANSGFVITLEPGEFGGTRAARRHRVCRRRSKAAPRPWPSSHSAPRTPPGRLRRRPHLLSKSPSRATPCH